MQGNRGTWDKGEKTYSGVQAVLASQGQTLDEGTRARMEPFFGHDFSRVRVHTSPQAAQSAQALHARAYTVNDHMVFGTGQYAPRTPAGQRLIAHELAHVVQQGRSLGALPADLAISSPADRSERQAAQAAEAAMQGFHSAPARAATSTSAPGGAPLQRASLSPLVQRDLLPGDPPGAIGGAVGAAGGTGAAGLGLGPAAAVGAGAAAGAGAAGAALPRVSIGNFRNSGTTNATENNCPLCPLPLGLLATSGKNRMELRGDISGHVAGAQYNFKRTKERATWKKAGDVWSQVTHVGPGADDDLHDSDESLAPVNDHIYVEDGPGFTGLANPIGDAAATEAVYKASFVETCNVRVGTGAWTKSSNEVAWHSVTWLEKSGANWVRTAGSNEIEPGSTFVDTGSPYGLGDFPTAPGGETAMG